MTRGALIFAHNSRDIDYAQLAIISGGLAKKHLGIPVSLITDSTTIDWMILSKQFDLAKSIFDKIIEVEKPITDNKRVLHDGVENKTVPFVNANRSNAWDLTPYDETLLIDSDYLIFSDRLNQYWTLEQDVVIAPSMNDIQGDRIGYHDRYVSDTGIHLYWATTVMFKKNEHSKIFFKLVETIRSNYDFFADIFRYSNRQYRNDIAFSVAKHILDGFQTNTAESLPSLLTVLDKDILQDVSNTGKLTFLISTISGEQFHLASTVGQDVHVMNKQSILRNANKLLELV
jgi:hypothetical protein